MMTCGSERSGRASREMRGVEYKPSITRAATIVRVISLFVAQMRISFSIMVRRQRAEGRGALPLFAPPFLDQRHEDGDQLGRFLPNRSELSRREELCLLNELEPVQRLFELHQTAVDFRHVLRFRSRTQCFAEVRPR